ncbi:retrovirus-related pol polyprotein from transposon TNT 1-94 [Tanacetum coccineum]|uniref:Retrovirus-related pol polyprotein from transposon TNT 1-94 n=1 Tax=Tanacetum coccineum TaxID=301880 RepID=A0ABQ5F1P2_9ASTR
MKWVPKVRKEDVNTSISPIIDNASRITNIIQLVLFIIDSGCTKHMTGNLKLIPGSGNIMINRVYYVEGLNHNLFSVGHFCDADLEHRRLSHLNFNYINLLSKKDIVIGLPKLKYVKDQLCSSCVVTKAKKEFIQDKGCSKFKRTGNLLHMNLCGPMRVESINEKKYIMVIVDDYFRYTWTLFLRSKDETPEVLKDFLKMIQRNFQAQVITVRTEKGTEFLNKTLHAYFKEEGIEHQTSTPRTPE